MTATLFLVAAALIPALYLQRVSAQSLQRTRHAWLWTVALLAVVTVGIREPWIGVIGAYLLFWWPQPAHFDPLRREPWEKARTVAWWGAIGATWFLALEAPAWVWAALPWAWGAWAWACSAAMAWQTWRGDPAKVRGWWGTRSVAGAFIALILPLLPLWAWPGPLVGIWLSGPSWLAVVALLAACCWRWPGIGIPVASAVALTGATLGLLIACGARVGAMSPLSVPDYTSDPPEEGSNAGESGDRDDDSVGPGRADGSYLVERGENAQETRQVGPEEPPPGLLRDAIGALPVGREAQRGRVAVWWHTLRTRPLELTPRGDSLDSLWQRTALLRHAWSERAWLGTGPGTTHYLHQQANARGHLAEPTGTLHNEPAQLALEYGLAGVVGGLLFIWRAGSGLQWGDPYSACVVAGGVLALGTMCMRAPGIGLVWLLACAEVAR